MHPDDLPAAAERWAQAVRDGGPCEMRHRLRAADGSYRWFLLRSRPLRDARGRIERWVGSLTDVDDLLRTERALRESESRYRELVHNANSAIIRWRKDSALTFFNEYAEQFFGYRADEVLGKHVGILVPDQDSDGADLTRLVEDIVRHPDRYRNGVNENICRDGRRVWMSWTNRPILDEGGTVSEILAIGSDITERVRIEQALRYQLHLNQSITDRATDSIIVTDAQGRVTFANPEAQRVFGYATEELVGSAAARRHPPPPRGRPTLSHERMPAVPGADSGEVVRDHEGVFFHRDGSQIIVTASNAALEFDGRRVGAALVLHDITERKKAEAALRERTERYELVLAGAQDAIWDWDVEHRRVHFSPPVEDAARLCRGTR
ncbi:MAG: PAS domain S-box protein [Comamonadaceae bacterium]|nr:PAS domain S-box protein [Comamonadaceae bacterium]